MVVVDKAAMILNYCFRNKLVLTLLFPHFKFYFFGFEKNKIHHNYLTQSSKADNSKFDSYNVMTSSDQR